MNTVQIVLEIMQEERGYSLKHYEECGYPSSTMRNWRKARTVPSVTVFGKFLEDMNYCHIELLKKVADYADRKSTSTA